MERRRAKESAADQEQRLHELEELQEEQEMHLKMANAERDRLRASMQRLQEMLKESMLDAATVAKQKAHEEHSQELAAMQQEFEEMKLKSDEAHIAVLAELQKTQLEKAAAEAAKQAAEDRAYALEEQLLGHSEDSSILAELERAKQEIEALKAKVNATQVMSLSDLCDLPARGTSQGRRSRADDAASFRSSRSTSPPCKESDARSVRHGCVPRVPSPGSCTIGNAPTLKAASVLSIVLLVLQVGRGVPGRHHHQPHQQRRQKGEHRRHGRPHRHRSHALQRAGPPRDGDVLPEAVTRTLPHRGQHAARHGR
jgi:hypothetical protein